jgi:hypothetical protein
MQSFGFEDAHAAVYAAMQAMNQRVPILEPLNKGHASHSVKIGTLSSPGIPNPPSQTGIPASSSSGHEIIANRISSFMHTVHALLLVLRHLLVRIRARLPPRSACLLLLFIRRACAVIMVTVTIVIVILWWLSSPRLAAPPTARRPRRAIIRLAIALVRRRIRARFIGGFADLAGLVVYAANYKQTAVSLRLHSEVQNGLSATSVTSKEGRTFGRLLSHSLVIHHVFCPLYVPLFCRLGAKTQSS